MEVEKGKTFKVLKEKHTVPGEVTEQLKYFTRTKKSMLNALKDGEKTIPQLAVELNLPSDEVLYYLMSLLKYGLVETGEMDDMDEYYFYKIKEK